MAKRTSRFKRAIVIISVSVLGLAGAGVAYAYWTSTGTGDGIATTGQAVAFTIAAADPVGNLAPGDAGQTIAFTVTNPATGPQYLSGVTVTMADAAGVAWVPPAGCLIADYTASISTQPATGDIAAGATRTGGVATVTLADTTADQDACQGAIVPLHFVASVPA